MSGEKAAITAMADLVSKEIFEFFKWESVGPKDMNFACHKGDKHSNNTGTHPTDVVFRYIDPYSGNNIYLHTDLKSYSKKSINKHKVREALRSLAESIDCATGSSEWQDRYYTKTGNNEVRGMLFIYNNDANYDKDFIKANFQGKGAIQTDNLNIPKGKVLHIIHPSIINYLTTIKNDIAQLSFNGHFNKLDYNFYYPELIRRRSTLSKEECPATVEVLSNSYMIIEYGRTDIDENGGFLIYYRNNGSDEKEFVFLFDHLAKTQILSQEKKIRIRACNHDRQGAMSSNFHRAIESYCNHWRLDERRRDRLKSIDLSFVENIIIRSYKEEEVAGRHL